MTDRNSETAEVQHSQFEFNALNYFKVAYNVWATVTWDPTIWCGVSEKLPDNKKNDSMSVQLKMNNKNEK